MDELPPEVMAAAAPAPEAAPVMTPDQIVSILTEAGVKLNEIDPEFGMLYQQALGAVTALLPMPTAAPESAMEETIEIPADASVSVTPQA